MDKQLAINIRQAVRAATMKAGGRYVTLKEINEKREFLRAHGFRLPSCNISHKEISNAAYIVGGLRLKRERGQKVWYSKKK